MAEERLNQTFQLFYTTMIKLIKGVTVTWELDCLLLVI